MLKNMKKRLTIDPDGTMKLFWFYVLIIVYLLYGTGIVSDDYVTLVSESMNDGLFASLISGNNLYLARPLFKFFYAIYFSLMGVNNYALIDYLKIIQIILIFYQMTKFFSLFLDSATSMMASFLFIFFPTHDSTTYFFLATHLNLTIALYFYAYYLVHSNKLIPAGIISTIASFVSYGSPPVAFSLFIYCVVKRSYRKGLILLIPNIIYSFYFVVVTTMMKEDTKRLPDFFSFSSVLKQFIMQICSFFDAMIGPSFFLKIWYSILENSLTSIILATLFLAAFALILKARKESIPKAIVNKQLLAVLIVLVLSSLGMFAVTGYYPQIAFNLGNRVTIYGSLLAAYLIVVVPMPKYVRRGILLILFGAIVGISTHWKYWNLQQVQVVDQIRSNKVLSAYNASTTIYVSGNQYSRMGPFSHIEFFSESYVVHGIFTLAGHANLSLSTLNKRFAYENGIMNDKKHNFGLPIRNTITVYDSVADRLLTIPAQDVNGYIKTLPVDYRHWIQFIENEKLNKLILLLMPRFGYAL
jgi:hypothetical protein